MRGKMKKLFNHTKRPVQDWEMYEEDDSAFYEDVYDMDEAGQYDAEDGYAEEYAEYYTEEPEPEEVVYEEEYYGGEAGQYYEDEAFAEDAGQYYAGDNPDGEADWYDTEGMDAGETGQYDTEEFYAEENDAAGGVYEEDYYDGEFYAEEGEYEDSYYADEYGQYHADEAVYEDEAYGDDFYIENEEEPVYGYEQNRRRRKKQGIFADIREKVAQMGAIDRVITAAGVVVLIMALVTGSVYVSASIWDNSDDEFVAVGAQIEHIEVIGERGLMAVSDTRIAKLAAAEAIAAEQAGDYSSKDYGETDYKNSATVKLELVSVLKDLKIKFTNKESGKLVPNVPFSVTVTRPDGKTETWTDDDMDGIIYKKELTPGGYKVAVNELTDEKYALYTLPADTQSVEVKKDIAYKKVDVTNEIKKETEVNVAKEDTKQNQTVVESALTDTVAWVESTSTALTYREVPKSTIPDPATIAKSGSFLRMTVSGNVPVPTPTPTPLPVVHTISLDQSTASLFVDKTLTLTATMDASAVGAITAFTSDDEIAEVSVNGNQIVVTGIAPGSVTITAEHPATTEARAFCTVTVRDGRAPLKDKDGNQLYVLEGETYREATYEDYYTKDRFFVKGEAKYTGWQTLDGHVYFFDGDGNKVTGEQVIQGAKYNFASDGSLVTDSGTMGIDVSRWNGDIDWNAVKNSGVSYVIIRVGYRGSSQGTLIDDPKFQTNIKGATAAGLKVGVYFFTQAVDEVEAVAEASMVLDRIQGYRISYPVFLDVEPSGGRADSISKETRTAVCKAFCATIQNANYTAGIYANKTWLSEKINTGALGSYKIWLAQYAASPTYTGRYDMWQYKSTGKITGIKGDVDMNLSYLGY